MHHDRRKDLRGMVASVAFGTLLLTTTAAIGQNITSPFAGNVPGQEPNARQFSIPEPTYEKPAVTMRAAAMVGGTATVGTAVSALAQVVAGALPAGVTLRVPEGTPAFIRVGLLDVPGHTA